MLYFYMSCMMSFFGFTLLLLGSFFLIFDYSVYIDWEIISLNSLSICSSFIFDYMSMMFVGCVFIISSMVIYYSHSYMLDDMYKVRFLLLVFLFVISMMLMIMSPNMISILMGWDGLGLVSYCLVIYFQNSKSYNAGMLTIVTNRIGDVCILICISWMMNFGSWNFMYYFYYMDDVLYIIFLLVVLASFTKSAQIPFSSWLPAAMAAPTPVSSLVHSSTLVTAGVYLLIRFSPIIYMYDCMFFFMVSLLTMFMSGLGANFEYDLKKIVALSTLSQLGLMMVILFMGHDLLAFFHLLTHAFFKALLFLCSGVIIHSMNDSQDIREMGFVNKLLPYTSSCFIAASFSLSGIPFLSGFYSKDMIIEYVYMFNDNFVLYLFFLFSIIFTVSYTFRLFMYLMVIGRGVYSFQSYSEDSKMMYSMVILFFFSVILGSFLGSILFKTPFFFISLFLVSIIPILTLFLGIMFGYFLVNFNLSSFSGLIFYLGSMWYLPSFSTYMIYYNAFFLSKMYSCYMDSGWIEFFFSRFWLVLLSFLSKINYIIEYKNIKLIMFGILFLFIMIII